MSEKQRNEYLNNELAKLRTKEALGRVAELARLEDLLKEHPTIGEEILMKEVEHYLKLANRIHDILDRLGEQKI